MGRLKLSLLSALVPPMAAFPDSKSVHLTFDDGPDPIATPKLLELLNHFGVKASFFLTGSQATRYPDVVQRQIAAGHCIGIHGYGHRSMMFYTHRAALHELGLAAKTVGEICGRTPRYFRPPYGRFGPGTLAAAAELSLKIVLWTMNPSDYKSQSPEQLTRRIVRRAMPGDVILLHDRGKQAANTLAALPAVIRELQNRGLRLDALPSPA